jgi:hypothetical protein
MSRTLKMGGLVLLAVILIGAAVLMVRRAGPPAVAETAPTTVTVARGSIKDTVSATGNFRIAEADRPGGNDQELCECHYRQAPGQRPDTRRGDRATAGFGGAIRGG